MFTCQGRKTLSLHTETQIWAQEVTKTQCLLLWWRGLEKDRCVWNNIPAPWDPTVLQESHVGALRQVETVQFRIAKDVVCSPLPSLQTKRKGKRLVPAWCWWKAHFSWSGGISELQLTAIMLQLQHLTFTIAPRCSLQGELSLNLVKEMQSWNQESSDFQASYFSKDLERILQLEVCFVTT